eukprot:449146_1
MNSSKPIVDVPKSEGISQSEVVRKSSSLRPSEVEPHAQTVVSSTNSSSRRSPKRASASRHPGKKSAYPTPDRVKQKATGKKKKNRMKNKKKGNKKPHHLMSKEELEADKDRRLKKLIAKYQ